MIQRYFPFLDAVGSGTPTYFGSATGSTGSSSFQQETKNITGAAGSVVTLQVTTYTVNNPSGQLLVNGTQVYLNTTFTVTLDGAGAGSFLARVQGDPSYSGTVVFGIFTIIGVSVGSIGSPASQGISKAF